MSVDTVRHTALAAVERAERLFVQLFLVACVAEAVMLAALLYAVDRHDRTHLLLLIGFVGSYSIVILAIVALGAHVSRIGQRILKAVALTHSKD